MRLRAVRGDITNMKVDAIVNAANERLAPGGGVCGAIFAVAGPKLIDACNRLGSCPTGQARLTEGFGLPARFIIHAVAPIWQGGGRGEAGLLTSCYRSIAELARAQKFKTLAVPAIGTGIYGYPLEEATEIAVQTLSKACADTDIVIDFVCFRPGDLAIYEAALARLPA